jgi:CheY-like chemotaxis protein
MKNKSLKKGLVIYADDDPDDLFLVSEGFLEHAPQVDLITVRDGAELFDCLQTLEATHQTPCLLILDINMPRITGKEVLRQLRQMPRYEDLPVVLFTTSSSPQDIDFAESYNAGFMTKPGNFTDIAAIIEQFFHQCSEEIRKQLY